MNAASASPPDDAPDTQQDPRPEIQGDGTRVLSERHREHLAAHAVDPDLAAGHVGTVERPEGLPEDLPDYWASRLPAMLYRWRMGDRVEWQLAPDDRNNGKPKYLFRENAEVPLNQVRDDGRGPILLVEGSKQHLAAATSAAPEYAIYGMAGKDMWTDTDPSFAKGRPVTVVLDADLRTNRDVWESADAIRETYDAAGATAVTFAHLPKRPTGQGLDDFLAKAPEQERAETLARLLDHATGLGKPPAKRRSHSSPWFGEGGLKAQDVAHEIWRQHPAALTLDKRVALYQDGVYRPDDEVLMGALVELLGNDHRPGHLAAVKQVLTGTLAMKRVYLPERLDRPWINVRNGMVDLETGELHDHDARLFSSIQFPVTYDPAAACPTFLAWAEEIIGDQLDDLLEASAAMLDPSTTPGKAILLFGPSRSGKGTYLRLLKAIVGVENTSAVTLHQLADDRFAAARVYRKALNAAGDLSAGHIEDISMFKMLTGEDLIPANPKFGKPFEFTNQALFAFSANELPTVGEGSRAYSERMKPFRFGHSFAGREDPQREAAMLAELPGLLNLLVSAWRQRRERGRALVTDPAIRKEFEAASNRVQQWLDEEMEIVRTVLEGQEVSADGSTPTQLKVMFETWAAANSGHGMGRNKLVNRLTSINGVVWARKGPNRAKVLNIRKRRGSDDPPDGSDGSAQLLFSGSRSEEEGEKSNREGSGPKPSEPSGASAGSVTGRLPGCRCWPPCTGPECADPKGTAA